VSFTINAASAPTLTSLAPTSATVGGAAFTLTLTGTGFVAGATVNFGSSPAITPSSVTSTQIAATIPAADIATAGTVNVTVTNPAGGGTSNAQTFTINNPAPTAASLSPTSATARRWELSSDAEIAVFPTWPEVETREPVRSA